MKANKSLKRITSVVLSMLMLVSTVVLPETVGLTLTASSETVDVESSGEQLTEVPEGYTAVRTIEDLYSIRSTPSGKYILMNDIDLSSTAQGGEWDGGNGWVPIPSFSGILNGNGHIISNINFYGDINSASFIRSNSGTITDLYISNMNISGSIAEFGFALFNYGTIEDLHFEDVNVNMNRGSDASYGTVVHSNSGQNAKISRCSVSGNISVTSSQRACVGGIAAYSNGLSSYIGECYSSANITVLAKNANSKVGGIVSNQVLETSSVTSNYSNKITNCYNSGKIESSIGYRGGIVGYSAGNNFKYSSYSSYNREALITYCLNFKDGRIRGGNGDYTSVGANYCLSGSEWGQDGTELTAPLMKQQASYLGLDFTNTWEMFNGRPQLKNNREFKPVSMKFKQTPKKLSFNCGDSYSVDGTLEVTYTGGNVIDVPITSDMASGYDMTKVGTQTVTITYGNLTITYPINVLEVFSTGIKLDKTKETIEKGSTLQLTAEITPDNTTNKKITWTTSDSKIAAIDENGKVTAVAPGKAAITATTSNGKKATCTVTVIIPAGNITLDTNYISINKDETYTLKPSLTPSDSTDKLTWQSSNKNVAAVDGNGTITANGAGTANITVTTESGVFASCFVEVSAPAKGITLSSETLDMIAGNSTKLLCTIDPNDTTDEFTWSASSSVVSISASDDGKSATIYANKAGTATVTVTASSGVKADCTVNVVQYANNISFKEYYTKLEKGDTYTAVPILNPADSSDPITWHSDNTSVATVDNNGKITAVSKGSANISAQIINGQNAVITVEVTVSPKTIKLDKTTAEIIGNNSIKLQPTITPTDADTNLTWSSSNSSIAYVDSDGTVYGVSSGTAKITVKTENGLSDNCDVTVKFIDISKSEIKLSYTEVEYDGYDKTPPVTVTYDGKTLSENTDYTVAYKDNNSIGTATVTITGIGSYIGTKTAKFTIKEPPKVDISKCTATLNQSTFYYDGYEKKPTAEVKLNGVTLYEGTDYTISYKNNRNIGTAAATITGIGGYTGTKTLKFTIAEMPKTDISSCNVTLLTTSYTYNGTAREPLVTVKDGDTTLTQNTDYTVSYSNNVNVGTATVTVTGIGNYQGIKTVNFTITEVQRTNISSCTITLSKTSYTYDGTAKKPTVTVKNGTNTLYQGVDYTVAYSNNVKVGTATVTVTGIGNYTGTKTANYTIASAPKTDISSCTVTLSQSVYTYDGGAKRPTVTVKRNDSTLISGTDYTVKYANNTNVGTATVTVTGTGNYTGTKNVTFIIKSPTAPKKAFTWGSDNWNFLNSSYSGDFSSGTYRSQINTKYKNTLKENLTASEYQSVFVGTWYSSAQLDQKFAGSCYGMSSTTLLAKQGLLPYASYQPGADELHDLSRPTSNDEVSSLITYYQMLQFKTGTQQRYKTVLKRSNEENIKELLTLLDSNDTVLVGFKKDGWGGHAILAYSYEYGSYTKNGVTYQGRIRICDPNSSSKNDENYYIYFNTKTYSWAIPAYSGITSTKGAVFMYIGADINLINQGGYLSGSNALNNDNFIARLDAFSVSDNRSVAKVQAGENGTYMALNAAPGEIEEDYSYVLGNESEGTVGYNLYDGDAAYKVSQNEGDKLELSITYDNCYLIGGSKAGESVIFDKSGYVEVHGESAEFAISMTMNDESPTDWFTVAVKGQGSDTAALKQVENGWVVSADNLSNVEVKVNNKYDMAYTTFTTKYPSALIYEINEDTIGIAVDKDENGTYETVLDTKTTKANNEDPTPEPTKGIYGDLDGDGIITSADSLLILRQSVSLEHFDEVQKILADVDSDNKITSADALEVLRYSVGLSQNNPKISKEYK